jgi:CheY-like chemotaxis protein
MSGHPTLLSVDDDLISQRVLTAALSQFFRVVSENSGANAVTAAESSSPELILLDLSMPNVDGFEVLTKLKHHPVLSSVPVICLSGHNDQESRERAYKLGASAFMVKPINVKTIASDLRALVSKMNSEVYSKDRLRRVFIGHNSRAVEEEIKTRVTSELNSGANVLMLSFLDAENFCKSIDPKLIEQDRFVFLQVKPSLVARLPYLQELSSIVEDIQSLVKRPYSEFTLFVDGIERLVNLRDLSQATGTAMTLSDTLGPKFAHIDYFCTSIQQDEMSSRNLNQTATVLVGNSAA